MKNLLAKGKGSFLAKRIQAAREGGIRMRTIHAVIFLTACLLLLFFLRATRQAAETYNSLEHSIEKYVASELAANNLKHASDHLTTQVRMFAVTGDAQYMDQYFQEALVSLRREEAVQTLASNLSDTDAYRCLENALQYSNALMERESKAMRLIVEAKGYSLEGIRQPLAGTELTAEEAALSGEEKMALALSLVHDGEYQRYDALIDENVSACILDLTREREEAQQNNQNALSRLLLHQRALAFSLLAVIAALIAAVMRLVLLPLEASVKRITRYQSLPITGAYELRYFAQAYNTMYEENQRNSAHLRHEAEHDPLTGLFNRGAFDKLRQEYEAQPIALMVLDVDNFKDVNDTRGHETGDEVLKKVASLLDHNFRFTDYPCRIGGDEFAVIMTDASSRMKDLVREKLRRISASLRDTSDGLPAVTLSIGVAFHDREDGTDDIYKDADRALYAVKTHGRDGCEFYGESYMKF